MHVPDIHVRHFISNNQLTNNYKNKSGIIYCYSRKNCEELTENLMQYGFSVDYYHAGLNKKSRESIQEEWLNNKIKVIVATIAFGMGIDKPDIRYVIHASIPSDIESFYQEIGRAGRDGALDHLQAGPRRRVVVGLQGKQP